MDFTLGLLTGYLIMWIIGKKFLSIAEKEKDELKDFETWKKWKNKK